MDILRKILLPVVTALLLTSCYSEFDFEPGNDPVLCLNSLMSPGDSIKLQVTRTWEWTEGKEWAGLDVNVEDAEAYLYVNGQLVEKMTPKLLYSNLLPPYLIPWDIETRSIDQVARKEYIDQVARTGFIADYIPSSGDVVSFVVKSDKYGEATAEVTIPYPVEIDKVETTVTDFTDKSDGKLENYSMSCNMLAWFTDPGETTDYYKLDAGVSGRYYYTEEEKENGYVWGSFGGLDITGEPLLTEHVSVLESIFSETSGYTIFSDRQISGKSYPLHISLNRFSYTYYNPYNNPEIDALSVDIELMRLSESYYRHVLSVWVANDGLSGILGDAGVGEPVYAASNVSTGAGVVAAATKYRFSVNIRELINEQLRKTQ